MEKPTSDDVRIETIARLEAELRRRGMRVVYPMEMEPDLKISVLQNFINANPSHILEDEEDVYSENEPAP